MSVAVVMSHVVYVMSSSDAAVRGSDQSGVSAECIDATQCTVPQPAAGPHRGRAAAAAAGPAATRASLSCSTLHRYYQVRQHKLAP